jgi:hypothetical protein
MPLLSLLSIQLHITTLIYHTPLPYLHNPHAMLPFLWLIPLSPPIPHFPHPHPIFSFVITLAKKNHVLSDIILSNKLTNASYILSVYVLAVQQDKSLCSPH